MKDSVAEIEALVQRGCAALPIRLADAVIPAVARYVLLLRKWNQRINLVGTRDLHRLVSHHIVDSLAVVPHIPAGVQRLVDVGSGAGLPGALIAIARADVQVTALEPVHKKHAFLATIRRELPLDNLRSSAVRMEAYRLQPDFMPFDIAVSRAAFPVPEWLDRARTLVHENGLILAMEGREQHDLPIGAERHMYRLDERQRAIIKFQVGV